MGFECNVQCILGGFILCVPIGRDGGFTQKGTTVFGDRLTRFFKAKDGFVKFTWNRLGLKPPK